MNDLFEAAKIAQINLDIFRNCIQDDFPNLVQDYFYECKAVPKNIITEWNIDSVYEDFVKVRYVLNGHTSDSLTHNIPIQYFSNYIGL